MEFRDYVEKKGKEFEKDCAQYKPRHSLFYHNQFEGWSEERVPKANGKGYRILRTYTSKYYRQELTKKKRVELRILYLALFLVAVFCYVAASCMEVGSNYVWYAVLPTVLALPALVCILIAFVSYIPAIDLMKIPDYKNGVCWLKKASFAATALLGASVFLSMLSVIIHPEFFGVEQALYELLFIIALLCTYMINWLEKRIEYTEVPNEEANSGRG